MSTWGSPTDSPWSRVAHQATERYLGHMPTTGGLKLALQAATRDDRRLRFAQVKLRTAGMAMMIGSPLRCRLAADPR